MSEKIIIDNERQTPFFGTIWSELLHWRESRPKNIPPQTHYMKANSVLKQYVYYEQCKYSAQYWLEGLKKTQISLAITV